jgi:hypothetical protein
VVNFWSFPLNTVEPLFLKRIRNSGVPISRDGNTGKKVPRRAFQPPSPFPLRGPSADIYRSASLRVRCPPNQNPIWGKPGFERFLQNWLCGLRAIIGIKSLPILGRLEGQALNRAPKYDLRDPSDDTHLSILGEGIVSIIVYKL